MAPLRLEGERKTSHAYRTDRTRAAGAALGWEEGCPPPYGLSRSIITVLLELTDINEPRKRQQDSGVLGCCVVVVFEYTR